MFEIRLMRKIFFETLSLNFNRKGLNIFFLNLNNKKLNKLIKKKLRCIIGVGFVNSCFCHDVLLLKYGRFI